MDPRRTTTARTNGGTVPPLVRIARELRDAVAGLRFAPPTAYVYNPLEYARVPHEAYLERFGGGRKEIVLIGMNPGPFGMAQTGVPFGDVELARDWLGLEAPVESPPRTHPSRPILGFACPRREVSGSRFWGWARERFGTPARFFARFFVANYCPLAFLEASGRNRTPDKLPAAEQAALFSACDRALRETLQAVEASVAVGIGAFAERRLRLALADLPIRVGRVPHPSPASPAANRGWARQMDEALAPIERTGSR